MQKPVKLALIGAGNRGRGIFGQYALDMPHRAKYVAVAEPDEAKRNYFAELHKIPQAQRFADVHQLFAANIPEIEGVVIATQDKYRIEPIFGAMEKKWHILTEKPLCVNVEELIKIYDHTLNYEKFLIVGHQLRYTPIYSTIKTLVDSGKYGTITELQHSENVCYHHTAHSFTRGMGSNSLKLSSMLLQKSCHDMDLTTYISGKKIKRVASFGSLNYFKQENCPPNAPKFCLDGCPHSETCPYDVIKLYFNEDTDPAYLRQMGVVKDKNHLMELLKTNQFGRCVFQCDNDVVDNQVVAVEFEDGTTSSFTMCSHNGTERRTMKISLTNGEIDYNGADPNHIVVWSHNPLQKEIIEVAVNGTHGGGDRAIMNSFVNAIASNDRSKLLTPIEKSFEGHLLVFAAEEARRTGKVVSMREFEASARASLTKMI